MLFLTVLPAILNEDDFNIQVSIIIFMSFIIEKTCFELIFSSCFWRFLSAYCFIFLEQILPWSSIVWYY